jgi:hypothetical protein
VLNKVNPHFKNRYADLLSIMDSIRAPFLANGVAIIQGLTAEEDRVTCETMLVHGPSGEWISSSFTITASASNPQALCSASTYARRYSVAAMCAVVADDDDDGEAASHATGPKPAHASAPAASAGDVAIKFGRGKDKNLSALPDDDVRWYIGVWEKDLGDPEKAKYQAKSRENIATAQAILASRVSSDGSPASKWERVKEMAPKLTDETLRKIVKDATGKASAGALDHADFAAIATAIAAYSDGGEITF